MIYPNATRPSVEEFIKLFRTTDVCEFGRRFHINDEYKEPAFDRDRVIDNVYRLALIGIR